MDFGLRLEVIKKLDLEWKKILNFIPIEYRDEFSEHCFLAGGCIYSLLNDKEPNDFDIFCKNKEFIEKIKDKIISVDNVSDKAISFNNYKYQLVIFDIGNPKDVVLKFDFLHNMVYYKPSYKIVGVNTSSYLECLVEDRYIIGNNRLIFNKDRARNIGNCIVRISKFLNRGFTISKRQLSIMVKTLLENGDFKEEVKYMENNLNGGNTY